MKRGNFRTVLRNRQYLYWLFSANVSSVGYSVYAISIVWLAYTISHSYLTVGLVLFAETATYAGTFLVAPVVDRIHNQRTIYLVCYPVQALAAATIALGTERHFLTVPELLVLVVLISALWDLSWAAYNAAPAILLSKEDLFAAKGVGSLLGGANSILGYTSGGALILLVGPYGGMYLYAALLGAGALLAVPLQILPRAKARSSYWESFTDGWRTLVREPGRPLLQLATMDAVQGFFTVGPALFITLLSVSLFASSAGVYGVLFVLYVVGGVVAGVVLGFANPRSKAGLIMVGSLFASAALFTVMGVVPPLLFLLGAGWFLVGFTGSTYGDAKYTFLQGNVESDHLGRTTSNLYLFPGVASAVGALVLGSFATVFGPFTFGLVLGVGFLSAALLGVLLPGVKALRF